MDIFYDDGSTADSTNSYFSSTAGTFTAPKAGWYNVCASLRFKKGGDNTDIVIVHVSAKRSVVISLYYRDCRPALSWQRSVTRYGKTGRAPAPA